MPNFYQNVKIAGKGAAARNSPLGSLFRVKAVLRMEADYTVDHYLGVEISGQKVAVYLTDTEINELLYWGNDDI